MVSKVYMKAWEAGCKGITIYRDGSRDNQVLNIGKVNRKEEAPAVNVQQEEGQEVNTSIPIQKEVSKPVPQEVIPPPVIAEENRPHRELSKKEIMAGKKCPECGSDIQIGEGCLLCLNCGFSACTV